VIVLWISIGRSWCALGPLAFAATVPIIKVDTGMIIPRIPQNDQAGLGTELFADVR